MSDLRRAILLDWMIILCIVVLMFAAIPQIMENIKEKPVVEDTNVHMTVLLGDSKGRVIYGTLTLSKEDAATFMSGHNWGMLPPKEIER